MTSWNNSITRPQREPLFCEWSPVLGNRSSRNVLICSIAALLIAIQESCPETEEDAVKLGRRQFLHLAAGAAALPIASSYARAQAYPARPVRILVGFSAGGTQDIVARLIGQSLSERLGQQFVVENRPGANSNLAIETIVRAPPDGHTLGVVGIANVSTPRCSTSRVLICVAIWQWWPASTRRLSCWRSIPPFRQQRSLSSLRTPRPIRESNDGVVWRRIDFSRCSRTVQDGDRHRYAARRIAVRHPCSRICKRTGPGSVRQPACIRRAHQSGQTAGPRSHHCQPLGGIAHIASLRELLSGYEASAFLASPHRRIRRSRWSTS